MRILIVELSLLANFDFWSTNSWFSAKLKEISKQNIDFWRLLDNKKMNLGYMSLLLFFIKLSVFHLIQVKVKSSFIQLIYGLRCNHLVIFPLYLQWKVVIEFIAGAFYSSSRCCHTLHTITYFICIQNICSSSLYFLNKAVRSGRWNAVLHDVSQLPIKQPIILEGK